MDKHAGYFVTEQTEDFEQVLGLDCGPHLPVGGILKWTSGPRALFPSRQSARKAINRTEHYRLAFSENCPERKHCRIDPVIIAKDQP